MNRALALLLLLFAPSAHAEDTGLREILRLFADRQAAAWSELRDALTPPPVEPEPEPEPTPEPEPPPVTPADLTLAHLGSVRLPAYSGVFHITDQRIAAVHGSTDELWATWHRNSLAHFRHVGKIKLPATIGEGDPRSSPYATWVQEPVKVGEEFVAQLANNSQPESQVRLNGIADDGERLLLNWGQWYHVQPTQYRNFSTINRTLDPATETFHARNAGSLGTRETSNYLAVPPTGWFAGETVLRGNWWQSGYDGGPRCSTIHATDETVPQKFTTFYSQTNRVDETASVADFWHGIVCLAAPTGERYVAFAGVKGTAPGWYGEANAGPDGLVDPCQTGKGWHAPPYANSLWLYRVEDMQAVLTGEKLPHEPRPVRKLVLPGEHIPPCGRVTGYAILGDVLWVVQVQAHVKTMHPADIYEKVNCLRAYRIGWE